MDAESLTKDGATLGRLQLFVVDSETTGSRTDVYAQSRRGAETAGTACQLINKNEPHLCWIDSGQEYAKGGD